MNADEPPSISDRTRERMARLGIPRGTDDPTLLALGAEPLPMADGSLFDCPMCHGKGWTEWGDDDDPDAWEWCELCAGRGVAGD